MDEPKTRRESKKSAKDKRASIYSAKHIRLSEQAAVRHAVGRPAVAGLGQTSSR
jgi:hypothetical protein